MLLLLQCSNYEPLQLIIARRGARGKRGLRFRTSLQQLFFRYEKEFNNIGADLVTFLQ